jgi:hypothetical protein
MLFEKNRNEVTLSTLSKTGRKEKQKGKGRSFGGKFCLAKMFPYFSGKSSNLIASDQILSNKLVIIHYKKLK